MVDEIFEDRYKREPKVAAKRRKVSLRDVRCFKDDSLVDVLSIEDLNVFLDGVDEQRIKF